VRITLTCKDIDGAIAAPTAITLMHENPAGEKSAVTLSNPSTGVYTGDYTFVAADVGDNQFEAVATGAVIAADKVTIKVKEL
jgi:hypothetical protein